MEMAWCSEQGIPHSEFLAWTDEDRAKQVAYLMESGERCSMCGTAPWEWEEDRFAYEALTIKCEGCFRKEVANEGTESSPGVRMTLIPKRRAAEIRDSPKTMPGRGR
jgi:hypothetical protein